MTERLREFIASAETAQEKHRAALALKREHLVEKQRKERADLNASHEQRWARETAQRAARLNKGIRGLWDRVTGRYSRQSNENEIEALTAFHRDRREKDVRHLQEREALHMMARQQKQAHAHAQEVEQLHRDIAAYQQRGAELPALRAQFREAATPRKDLTPGQRRNPGRDRSPSREL